MFAQQGARVVLTGRRVTEGEEVARNIVAAGGDAIFQACDVTEQESVKEAVRQAERPPVRFPKPATDTMLITDPPPDFTISGIAKRSVRNVPK
jgi:NAD(P)-dependent dehydrogenase (short-subunit alcohol dehydrogenase family)